MDITLYVNSSQNNVVDKQIEMKGTTRVLEPFDNIDLLSPKVLIDYNSEFLTCNYAYIPELSRYYFIQDIGLETAKRMVLTLNCDVLKTYKNTILNATATVIRNEYTENSNVVDNQLPIDPHEVWVEGYAFPLQPFVNNTEPTDDTRNYVFAVRN